MYNLILVVMSVALLAIFLYAGAGMVSTDMIHKEGGAQRLAADFRIYKNAYDAHVVTVPGPPRPATWRDDLAPFLSANLQANPNGFSWSFGTGAGGDWFCASHPDPSPELVEAMNRLPGKIPGSTVTLSSTCGGSASSPTPGAPAAATISVSG